MTTMTETTAMTMTRLQQHQEGVVSYTHRILVVYQRSQAMSGWHEFSSNHHKQFDRMLCTCVINHKYQYITD
jgi:hypothetical protein